MTDTYYVWKNTEHRRDLLYGRPCRVVARGGMNSVLVEFTDGEQPRRVTCSRWAVRAEPPKPLPERLS